LEEFGACWEGLEDARTGITMLHGLDDLLMIARCSMISGGENAMEMVALAKAKEPLLRGFPRLPDGGPSHDYFSRLFRLLNPATFGTASQRFKAAFSERCRGIIVIDEKLLRGCHERAGNLPRLRLIQWEFPDSAGEAVAV